MKTKLAISSVILALALVGCNKQAPTTTPTSSNIPTAAATPTPEATTPAEISTATPTESATPGADATPGAEAATPEANVEGCISNLKTIGAGVNMYQMDNNFTYPASLDGVKGKYFGDITCPSTGTFTYVYTLDEENSSFKVDCGGENHTDAGLGKDLPAYDESVGIVKE